MAEKTINTRLVLRNADLSAWELSSETVLLKGEVALAKRTDGLYEIRIGDGEHVWKELSGTGFGHTKFYEGTQLSDITSITDAPNGSIGVVTQEIADGKKQKTAYVYNDTGKRWEALDGNYSADKVFFSEDVVFAGNYTLGNKKTKTSDTYVISAGTMSLQEIMTDVFTKELYNTTQITANVSHTGATTVEYGSKQTPTYTISYSTDPTKYDYKDIAVSSKITSVDAKVDGNLSSNLALNAELTATVAVQGTQKLMTFSGNALTASMYNLSSCVKYSDGNMPKTNLGNDDAEHQFKAGTKNTSTNLYTVYKPRYVKFTSAAATAPTSMTATELTSATTKSGSTITLEQADEWYKITDATWATKINISAGKYFNVYFVAPKAGGKSSWTAKTSDNVNVLNTPATTEMSFEYLNGESTTYYVYSITNATEFSDTACNITWQS